MLERYAQLPRGAQPFTESQGSVQVAGTGDHLASTEGSSAIRILHDDAHTQQGCEDATGDGSCLMPTDASSAIRILHNCTALCERSIAQLLHSIATLCV